MRLKVARRVRGVQAVGMKSVFYHGRVLATAGLLAGLGVGCVHRGPMVGLVSQEEGQAWLQTASGARLRIAEAGEGLVLGGLTGCEVEVEGNQLGKRLRVQEWSVRSAPGGGQPFVGRLRLFGSNWLIDDRSTGRPVIVDLSAHPELARHQGEIVLVVGYVVGAQTVRPVHWQAVAP